jgi:hypothetical protein
MSINLSAIVTSPSSVIGSGTLTGNLLGTTRASGVQYTNTTGRPLCVYYTATNVSNGASSILINSNTLVTYNGYGGASGGFFIVPIGATYQINASGVSISAWYEY